MSPGGGLTFAVLVIAGAVGVGIAWRWLTALSRMLPPRVLALHVAAGPCMVLGTIPAFLAWWAWRVRSGGDPAIEGAGVSSLGLDVLVLAASGGTLWLAGLWCLLEGHRRLAREGGRGGKGSFPP